MLLGMRPPVCVRALIAAEREQAEAGWRSADAFVVRRCQIVVASARGTWVPQIAAQLGCSEQPVRDVLHACTAHGVAGLQRSSSRPHRSRGRFDAAGAERLRARLHRSPRTSGQASSRWARELAAGVSFAQGLTPQRVSREAIRSARQRFGVSWQRATRWSTSPDPASGREKKRALA
jgi:hypothetical protein